MDKSPTLDFDREQQDIAIVKLVNNKRYVEDIDSSISFMNGKETELSPQALKSNFIKQMLIDGDLRVSKGNIIFKLKHASFIIRENENGLYYREGESIFVKDFETNQTVLLNNIIEEEKVIEEEVDDYLKKEDNIGDFF